MQQALWGSAYQLKVQCVGFNSILVLCCRLQPAQYTSPHLPCEGEDIKGSFEGNQNTTGS